MEWKGPLAHKVAVLTGLPLLFEVIFIVVLFCQIHQSDEETQANLRAAAVLQQTQLLSGKVVDTLSVLGRALDSSGKDSVFEERFLQESAGLTQEVSALRELLSGENVPEKSIQDFEQSAANVQKDLKEAKTLIASGNKEGVMQLAVAGQEHLGELRAVVRRISKPFLLQTQELEKKGQASQKNVILVLFCGVIVNIALAAGLGLFASASILKNISGLSRNIERFRRGEAPVAVTAVTDEISALDDSICKTEQTIRELQHQLHLSERRCKAVLASSLDGLLVLNADDSVSLANRGAEILLGYSSQDLQRLRIKDVVSGFDRDRCQRKIELDARRHDGEIIPVDVVAGALESGAHVVVLMDARPRHMAHDLREQAVRTLKRELEAPLAMISSTCGQLEKRQFSQAGIDKLMANAQDCNRLLLLIAKLEHADPESLERQRVSVKNLILGVTEQLRGLAEGSGIELRVEAVDVHASFDEEAMRRVIMNLVSNALKFSPPKSIVEVLASNSERDLVIEVCDQGRGIPQEKLSSLFERFQQVTETDRQKGSGLGLLICKQIVERHGGAIAVYSEVDAGSRFLLSFPQIVLD